jgi:hypothetical protein
MSRGRRLDYGDLYGSIFDDWELGFGAISVLRASMNLFVAVGAERNQILGSVVSKLTAEADVVDLKILRVPTMLASPAITLKYLRADLTIRCRIQPESSQLQRFHCLSICWRNSVFCGSGSSQ